MDLKRTLSKAQSAHLRRKSQWLTWIDAIGAVAMDPADHTNLFAKHGVRTRRGKHRLLAID